MTRNLKLAGFGLVVLLAILSTALNAPHLQLHLCNAVRGKGEYTGYILINPSTQNYCVLGFAMDKAFWPPKNAQE
jgi:hypothetical protein